MNIIRADFKNKYTAIVVGHRYQWDYGQVLMFEGIENLPPTYEVDFSNREDMGESITQIGTPSDGVPIPDSLLETGKTVYAYMFLHNTVDDGRTRYKVKIPVRKRPKPKDIEVTPQQQSTIDAAIAAFQEAAEPVREAARKAESAIQTYPRIIDGNWYVWNVNSEAFSDTGIKATGENGNGISDIRFNTDHTMTIILDDGSSYTTEVMRGEKGDRGPAGDQGVKGDDGNGISSITFNDDYSLTIGFTDGTDFTTPPIRGEKGEGSEDLDKVIGPDVNLLYYYDWVSDGADVSFVGNNIVLTATDSTKPAAAYIDLPTSSVVVSYDSKSDQSQIRIGHVNSSGVVSWSKYVTSSPSATVVTDNTVRVQLYVAQTAVAVGTTATFSKLQVEKTVGTGRPEPSEFSKNALTAYDYTMRRKITALTNEINDLKARVEALENQ